jgi:hypothetical protein
VSATSPLPALSTNSAYCPAHATPRHATHSCRKHVSRSEGSCRSPSQDERGRTEGLRMMMMLLLMTPLLLPPPPSSSGRSSAQAPF